jgi:hypothetical protein
LKRAILIWTSYAAFLALIFLIDCSQGIHHAPSLESTVQRNQQVLFHIVSRVVSSWEYDRGNFDDLKRELELELQDRAEEVFGFRAQLKLGVYPDGVVEIGVEYPPHEGLAMLGFDPDFGLVWALDFAQARVLVAPIEPAD